MRIAFQNRGLCFGACAHVETNCTLYESIAIPSSRDYIHTYIFSEPQRDYLLVVRAPLSSARRAMGKRRWRSLDVGADFLLGAEEGGFAGIEVLEQGDYTDADAFQDDDDDGEGDAPEETERDMEGKEQNDGGDERVVNAVEKAGSSSRGGRQEKRREARRLRRLEARRASSRRKKEKNTDGEAQDEEEREKKRSRNQDEVDDNEHEDLDAYLLREMEDEERRERSMRAASSEDAAAVTPTDEIVDLPPNSPWHEFCLHTSLQHALAALRFFAPTPIQSMTLRDVLGSSSVPASSLPLSTTHVDRQQIPIRDVVGAAVTGSGKTLAFTLPVLQGLLTEMDGMNASSGVAQRLRCLMLAPTRELAMQIAETVRAMLAFTGGNETRSHARASPPALAVGILVGGMSAVKQERVLAKKKPAIVVATPGRLWDIITKSSAGGGRLEGNGAQQQQRHHLHDLSGLRYLVIDEADRMLKKGQFAELGNVLDIIRSGRIAGENGNSTNRVVVPPSVLPQTFIFSATMNVHDDIKLYFKNQNKKDKVRAAKAGSLDALLRRLRFRRNPVIIDANTHMNAAVGTDVKGGEDSDDADDADAGLAEGHDIDTDADVDAAEKQTNGDSGGVAGAQASGLSSNVVETMIQVPEADRDAALYYVLKMLGGTSIVFCNAITTVKRVAALLKLLRVECVQLHANMIMKARLKALDKFKAHCVGSKGDGEEKSAGSGCVLIATDVASRGIDISGVNTVIHYHLPHNAELYVHRAGRAGRGRFDESAASRSTGKSLVIVTPQSYRDYTLLCKNMGLERLHDSLTVDPRLLKACAQRVNTAQKLERLSHEHQLSTKNASWMRRNADEAEIGIGAVSAGAAPVSVAAHNIDDDEDEDAVIVDGEETIIRRHPRGNSRRTSGTADAMRRELDAMLALPLSGPARRSKFPLAAAHASAALPAPAVPDRRYARKRSHRE